MNQESRPAVPCRWGNCGNTTQHPTGLCYVHVSMRQVTTPGGQAAFRTGDVIDLQSRIERESQVPVPPNTAGIPGFPFMTMDDVQRVRAFLSGDDRYRPSRHDVIDRFPISVNEVRGGELAGWEAGVYDGEGTLHVPAGLLGEPLRYADSHEDDSSGTVRLLVTESRELLALHDDQSYRVVIPRWDDLS